MFHGDSKNGVSHIEQKAKVLVVDDRPENILAMEGVLESEGLDIHKAQSGQQALDLMLQHEFAVVLLDVQMPEMDGFETATLMQQNQQTKHVPIVFVTALSREEDHILRGYECGAVDFLHKPIEPIVLRSKVQVFANLHRQKKALDTTSDELQRAVEELKKANQKILAQHKSVIEEERLKVLLQMAGVTAHQLSQPLTHLLGYIELIENDSSDPEQLAEDLSAIKEAGLQISNVVETMRSARQGMGSMSLDQAAIKEEQAHISVLSIEDSEADFQLLNSCFSAHRNIGVTRATGIHMASELIENHRFDLIFLDHSLPDGTSLDFLKMKKKQGNSTPVIVITGQGDEMIAAQLIQQGVYDYLPKSRISEVAISRIISNTMEKADLKREIEEAQQRLAEMAFKDELTGLYNRRCFMETLETSAADAMRYKKDLVLCMIDLDHFKKVNDTYGHIAGDYVLAEMGKLLREGFRRSDILCRYGGEELAIILPGANADNAFTICNRFRDIIAKHIFAFKDLKLRVTISIGIAALRDTASKSYTELLAMADAALYNAKAAGRNRVVVYQPEEDKTAAENQPTAQ